MPRCNPGLVEALRATADRLETTVDFRWSHQGLCVCGHLVQTTTGLPAAVIHAYALERKGNWADHATDYCETSRYPIDHLVASLRELGLSGEDIAHLERLDDPVLLRVIAPPGGTLNRNRREHVIVYLRTMAEILVAGLEPTPVRASDALVAR